MTNKLLMIMRYPAIVSILLMLVILKPAFSYTGNDAMELFRQGETSHKSGEYNNSLSSFQKALKIFKELNMLPEEARTAETIGAIYQSFDQYDKALQYYKEALDIYKKIGTPKDVSAFMNIIGVVYYRLNEYENAVHYYEEALKIQKKLNDPRETAITLNNIGISYRFLGRYDKALHYFKKALEIRRELKKPEGIATALRSVGRIYMFSNQYDEALRYLNEALEIEQRLGTPAEIATALDDIGTVYASMGRDKEALYYCAKALKIYEDSGLAQYYSISFSNIAAIYARLNQYDKALSYCDMALKATSEPAKSGSAATVLNNAGSIYSSLGRYDKALYCLEQALKIRRNFNNHREISTTLINIGNIYCTLGHYDKALAYDEEALGIIKGLEIPKHKATILVNIALAYHYLGLYDKALAYDEEALKIQKGLNDFQDMAVTLNNIGLNYYSLAQYDKAISYYGEALKTSKKINALQIMATALNNLGILYHSLGLYDKALSSYEKALRIIKNLNLPLEKDAILSNLALIYISEKKYGIAEEKLREAREEEKTGIEIINGAFVELYLATNKYDAAISILKKISPAWNAAPLSCIRFHTQKGLALKGMGSTKEASLELLNAVSLSEAARINMRNRADFFSGRLYGGFIRPYKALTAALAERSFNGGKMDSQFGAFGKDFASAAFYFAESTKARALIEAMAESVKKYETLELPPKLRKQEQDILSQLSAIENTWEDAYKKGKEAFKAFSERREDLKQQLDAFISRVRKDYPKYASLNYPRPIPAEQIPLKENEVLLEYALCDDASYLFKVKKGGVKEIIKIPKGKEEIENMVTEFCLPFEPDPQTQNIPYQDFSIQKANVLYNLLLADALKDTTPETNIIIVPDGILGRLPFEALAVNFGKNLQQTVFAVDRWNISYYQSATVLALNRMLGPSKASRPLFALGNPIYNKDDPRYLAYQKEQPEPILLAKDINRSGFRALATNINWGRAVNFTPLPETEQEIKSIARIFDAKLQPPDILLGIFANETNLHNVKLNQYRLLHFATHADLPGKIQGINEPFILLGQVENQGKDDGLLTLTEVLNLYLDADMVVLSACVTGRGKVMDGEGLLNFARVFQYAGAKTVLVSLWGVASEPTVEYMELLYRHLKDGKSKSEAVSLTRKEIKQKYPHPFFWSVFILHGEG